MKCLVFRLKSQIASFGRLSVGEKRLTEDSPTKSQILGLINGCLGNNKETFDFFRFDLASKKIDYSKNKMTQLKDYHTIVNLQKSGFKKIKGAITRKNMLEIKNDLNTTLSDRHYYENVDFLIAINVEDKKAEIIKNALIKPKYAPYIGRKCCVLSEPFAPEIITGNDIFELFNEYEKKYEILPNANIIRCDSNFNIEKYSKATRVKRDVKENIQLWQFSKRNEYEMMGE
jgi:CRISPR system Cascade subunit CasD